MAPHRAARARDAGDANETSGAWDLIELDGRVRLSQRRRRLVAAALSKGKIHAWEFPSFRNASREYIRNFDGPRRPRGKGPFSPDRAPLKFESRNRADKANSGR